MAVHTAEVSWSRGRDAFVDNRHSRRHEWRFDGGAIVRTPFSDPKAVDSEEAFIAALSSCHMLCFLGLAAQAGVLIESYDDSAHSKFVKDQAGRDWLAEVVLAPRLKISGALAPSVELVDDLHHRAHEACSLANSVKSRITIEGAWEFVAADASSIPDQTHRRGDRRSNMSRIAPLDPPYEDDIAQQFARIMPSGEPPLALFRTIALSPRAWKKFRAGSLLDDGPLTLRQREIVIDRVCARTGCEYEWGVHVAIFAERARLTEEEIAATVNRPPDAACWTESEQVLIRVVDALHDRATLGDDDYEALSRWYDIDQILEILMLAGFYRTVSYLANVLAMPLEEGAARFPGRATA